MHAWCVVRSPIYLAHVRLLSCHGEARNKKNQVHPQYITVIAQQEYQEEATTEKCHAMPPCHVPPRQIWNVQHQPNGQREKFVWLGTCPSVSSMLFCLSRTFVGPPCLLFTPAAAAVHRAPPFGFDNRVVPRGDDQLTLVILSVLRLHIIVVLNASTLLSSEMLR